MLLFVDRDGVLDEDFLKKYSPQLTATIRQMLHPDPSQRLSCFAIYTTSMERLSTYKTTQDEKDLLIRRLLEENNRLAGELQELRRNQQI